jgi:hypothetical protein
MMIKNLHYDRGDLVRLNRSEYFPTSTGDVQRHTITKIALFIKFWDPSTCDGCQIYVFEDGKFMTVSSFELSLLSKNEK